MRTVRRIGGPGAISSWSFTLSLGVFLLVTLIPTRRDQFVGALDERMLLAAVGTTAGLAVLAVAWGTVLRPRGRGSRPVVALAVFALAGGIQGLTVAWLRREMGLDDIGGLSMVISRAVAGVIWLALIAVVVDQARSHARTVGELGERIRAVEDAVIGEEDDLRHEMERTHADVLAPVREVLGEVIRRLAGMAGGRQAAAEAMALHRLVADEVRPRSHELLGAMPPELLVDPADVVPPRAERMRMVARLAVTRVAGPTWLAVVLPMALVLLFAVQQVGPLFIAVAGLAYAVEAFVLLRLAAALLDPRLPRMRTPVAAACVIATYLGIAAVAVANGWAWGGLASIGRWIEWPALITLPTVWLALATVRAGERQRGSVEARLEQVLDDLAVIATRRRQRIRHERQVLGRLLHGSTQATLLSVAARLALAADDADSGRAVRAAAADLAALRERLAGASEESWVARDALDDLVMLWSGAVEVRVDVADEVLEALDAAPATRAGVLDVVAEGLTNAVRHGGASRVDVGIGQADPHRMRIVVRDDGRGPGASTPGMGTELLDEVASAWALERRADGTVLEAWVVLDRVVLPA